MTIWELIHQARKTEGITRLYLQGPPGTGKTYWALQELGGPTVACQTTLNEDVSIQELMGHYLPAGAEFVWHDGPFVMAFRSGKPLIINEISRSSQAVQDALLSIMDDPSIAAMTLPSGETIRPGKGFQVIATSNSKFEELPEALQDRFDANFVITHPHPELVKALNGMLAGLGDCINNSYSDPARAVSPRRAIAFCKYKKTMDVNQAAAIAFGASAKDFLVALRSRGVSV